MVFDTDILIWFLRGNIKASKKIDACSDRTISTVTYIELLLGARDKREKRMIQDFIKQFHFNVLPLTENIGHRASIYIEEYALKVDLGLADALIAATAVESSLPLITANTKHYKVVSDLELKQFRP